MGWTDAFQDDHSNVHHQGHLGRDALAGAVAFEAVSAYQDHVAKQGKPVDHAMAKKLLAGFAGAAITRLVETKGLDVLDAHQLKHKTDHFSETVLVNEYKS